MVEDLFSLWFPAEIHLQSFNQPAVLNPRMNLQFGMVQTISGYDGFPLILRRMGPRLAKLTKPFSGRLKPFTARKLQSGADAQCLGAEALGMVNLAIGELFVCHLCHKLLTGNPCCKISQLFFWVYQLRILTHGTCEAQSAVPLEGVAKTG